jgi:enoyl-CoA hydratase/carnithine racemase
MIEVIEHEGIREVKLARPPANALSPELLREISAQVEGAPRDGVGAVVLSGAEGLFTGGLDVPLLLSFDRDGMRAALDDFFGAMMSLAESAVPVAAAITGHSPAGGAVLSVFCDWRVMAEGPFKIGFNEVRIGIPMPSVVADALARVVGTRQAELLCQTGRLLEPGEALAVGLVDRLAPVDQVVSTAIEWCRELTSFPAHALRATRRTVRGELRAIVERSKAANVEALLDEWYRPEVQAPLRQLADHLAGKR